MPKDLIGPLARLDDLERIVSSAAPGRKTSRRRARRHLRKLLAGSREHPNDTGIQSTLRRLDKWITYLFDREWTARGTGEVTRDNALWCVTELRLRLQERDAERSSPDGCR